MSEASQHPGDWSEQHERILKSWGENAICLQRIHDHCHHRFRRRSIMLTLPVIIMSTVTGTANFSMGSFDVTLRERISVIIGTVNLLAGMITTISQYLRLSELSEGHRVAALAYGKLQRNVGSELNLPRFERSVSGLHAVKATRGEMDRLAEQSPNIDENTTNWFTNRYPNVDLQLPAVMTLKPIEICISADTFDEKIDS